MTAFDIEIARTPNGYLVYLIHEGRAPADCPSWCEERVAVLSVKAPSLGQAMAHALVKYGKKAGYIVSDEVDDEPANV